MDPTKLSLPSDANASGRDLGDEELEMLREVIRSGHLSSTNGAAVPALEKEFAAHHGVPHAVAVSSGSGAVQTAVACLDPSPGDEIITTSITDLGAIAAILYQGAIPIFADVDPRTCNVTCDAIERRLSKHTRAIVVTHLFGNPCDMDPIVELAKRHGLPIIEDCAQAFLSTYKGRLVGTLGDIGCFSFQQGKHMTSGEGGMVLTRDKDLARRAFLFVNKAWGYGDATPDHYFLAPNFRLTELQGAVLRAQLRKLESVVARRRASARKMDELLRDLTVAEPPSTTPNGTHVYWKYCLRMNPERLSVDVQAFGNFLKARGVFCVPRYIQKPAFECQVIRDRVTFGKSRWPWEGAHMAGRDPVEYRRDDYPGTYEALARAMVLPWNERYEDEHLSGIAAVLHDAEKALRKGAL